MRRAVILLCLLASTIAAAQVRPAPEFPSDAVWLDSAPGWPHSIADYHGKVLLIDFWEYTCINCIRDFAVVKRWYAKYHPYGFEVLGVHFGEFPMGFKVDNVRRAAKRFRLPWPIVVDQSGSFWNAYQSDAWPNRYLIDPRGTIVLQVIGEGNNEVMEQRLRSLLEEKHPEVAKIPLEPAEDTLSPRCGVPTQETYVGHWHGRGALENAGGYATGKTVSFTADHAPSDGGVMLGGRWRTDEDAVIAEQAAATAELRYHARSVYAVVSAAKEKHPVRVDIKQDGQPLTQADAGADVRFDSAGSYVEVAEPRMYDLVKNAAFGSHLLRLTAAEAGFGLNSFTFGNDCQQKF